MNEPRSYLIRNGAATVDRFRTAATADRFGDEVAVGHLIDYSRHHLGRYVLAYLHPYGAAAVPLAYAEGGVGTLLVPLDDVQADSMHAGPALLPPAVEDAA